MTEPKRRGKRGDGQLIWVGKSWSARYWSTVDGVKVRRCVTLETDNRTVARAKLARLVAGDADAADVQRAETFEEAARRIVKAHGEQGLKTWVERMSRLERFAFPELGSLAVTAVRPAHVRGVLETAAQLGRSRTTVSHLKDDISTVLGELWRDEVVSENVALRVLVPKSAATDDRKRVILTDAEFERFMAYPDVSPELHIMALVSRAFGGMRTSDLHAWSWEHIDLTTWLDAHVPRPKTNTRDRLALPAMLVAPLQTWWDGAGRPTKGPVFPMRHGKGAGERRGKSSHAKRLRKALWLAGVRRGETPAQCELQTDTAQSRRVDFHSLRRAFNTALADAGVNVQTAMRLAGHRNASTHMRYVLLAERLETPDAALPRLTKANGLPKGKPPTLLSHENYLRPQRDLNPCYRRERPEDPSPDAVSCGAVCSLSADDRAAEPGGPATCPSGLSKPAGLVLDARVADAVLEGILKSLAERLAGKCSGHGPNVALARPGQLEHR